MQRILLVDDELGIIKMLKTILHKEGYTNIDSASTGKETMTKIMKNTYDLIVLDVMLPDIDGFKLCQKIRQHTFVPILFLTARTGDLDKLTGLGIGGDDYITKPFNPLEVVARINVQFRRMKQYRQNSMKQGIYHFGTVTVNKKEAKLLVDNREISCPAKEFELLLFLVEHPNQVFTAGQLYENVWGYESMGDEQTVKVHINRLRKKVEPDLKNPSYIINIRGIGYKFSFSEGGQI